MEKIKNLNLYQKIILIIMVIMTLIFIPIYAMTIGRVGYEYHNAILVPEKTDDATVYTGKIKGKQASFTVSSDRHALFLYLSGKWGIRTLDTLARIPHFECGSFDHSDNFP